MRILVVSNFYPPDSVGGAEIVAHRHVLDMISRGHEVCVFAGRQPKPGERHGGLDLDDVDGVAVHRTVVRSLDPSLSFHWGDCERHLEAVIRQEAPDVVHCHNVMGLGANVIPRAKSLGVPVIVTLHDYWGFCLKQTRINADNRTCADHDDCERCLSHVVTETGTAQPTRLRRDYIAWCLSQADRLVSPSQALADAYAVAGVGGGRIVVRSNGIDIARFGEPKNRIDGPVRFMFVGYLGEHKGLLELMDAVARIAARSELDGKWQLSILGDGHLRPWLEEALEREGRANVEFLGKVPQSLMPQLLSEHDVLVLPSIWPENEPVVLLESIAAGMAQIATAHGGSVDMVHDGRGGRLITPRSADALAAAMIGYIADPASVTAHRQHNLQRRGELSQSASCDAYEADYRALCEGHRKEAGAGAGHPIVICGGGWPTLPVSSLVNNLALVEGELSRMRLVAAAWADSNLWSQASALWVWAESGDEELIRRALRLGMTIIVSSVHAAAGWLETASPDVIVVKEPLEVVVALRSVARSVVLEKPMSDAAPFARDAFAMLSSAKSYSLTLATVRNGIQ